jgi:LPS O-antigen subunit length determinant protein (WzzB/FepE family)
MPKARSTYDDGIDLFEVFETLWEGKLLITIFTVIAILVGGGYILYKEPSYISRMVYGPYVMPPYYNNERVMRDFENMFYSKSIFEEWRKNVGETSLVYEDISREKLLDGFLVSKKEDEQFAFFEKSNIRVKTNKLKVMDQFFSYADYINKKLQQNYVKNSKEELRIMKLLFNNESPNDLKAADYLKYERYISLVNSGANVISIARPTKPKKNSPKSRRILVLSTFLGGMIGVFFILFRNIIRKYKEQVTKA